MLKKSVGGLFFLLLSALSLLLLAFFLFPAFADAFDTLVGAPLRSRISAYSATTALSLTELLLLLLPALLLALPLLAFAARHPSRMLAGLLAFLLMFFGVYTLTFAAGAHRSPLAARLGLSVVEPTAEELSACADWLSTLASRAVTEADDAETISRLMSAFSSVGERYGIPVNTAALPKRTLTPILARLGFFGLYAFPLGEVTVASECRGAVGTFTLAHELAHASGFSREAEADLLAFLVCLDSGDPYLVYAGAAGMLGRLLGSLHEEAPALWQSASEGLPDAARRELLESGESYEKGTAPTEAPPDLSYSETVILLCALYRTRN